MSLNSKIIDYLDLLRPSGRFSYEKEVFEKVISELKSFARGKLIAFPVHDSEILNLPKDFDYSKFYLIKPRGCSSFLQEISPGIEPLCSERNGKTFIIYDAILQNRSNPHWPSKGYTSDTIQKVLSFVVKGNFTTKDLRKLMVSEMRLPESTVKKTLNRAKRDGIIFWNKYAQSYSTCPLWQRKRLTSKHWKWPK